MREQILERAGAALGTTPARELSLRELAREIGASHGAPYKHFGDREGFLGSLAATCLLQLAEQQSRVDADDPVERLIAVGQSYVDWGADHPNAFQLVFDPALDAQRAAGPLADAATEHARVLQGAVQDAMTGGWSSDADPNQVGALLWSTVHGMTHLVLLGHVPRAGVRAALTLLVSPRARM